MIAIILFVVMIGLVVIGFPVALSMLIAAFAAILQAGLDPVIIPSIFSGGISNYTLIAVPFFVLLGNIMNGGGITTRIFDFCDALVGHMKGGLAQVNVLASVVFAGVSGTAAADAAGLGSVEINAMKEKGYDLPFTTGITLASSVLGPIIPPSVTFIVFASLCTAVSPAKLFMAGMVPGLLIAALLMLTVGALARTGKVTCPEPVKFDLKRVWVTFKRGFFALMAPVILVVTISTGVCTATEAGIIGVAYSLFVALVYHELTLAKLYKALRDTVISSGIIMFLVGCGTVIGWLIAQQRVPQIVSEWLLGISSSKFVILLLINVFLLVLGCFMDGTSIQLIMVPILVPIATALNMNLLTLGVMMTINVLIGSATPPVGMGLFIMSSVSDQPMEKVIKGFLPFFPALILGLVLITYVPFFTTWLPGLIG